MFCFEQMRLSRVVFFLFVVAGGSQVLAQQPARIVKSPVPFWNDAAPAEQPGAYFDARQNQLVLVMPSPGESNLLQVRYDIPNGAKASVDVSIQSSPAGTLRYMYSLSDDPQARQRSWRLRMLLPASDSSLAAGSDAWQAETEATTVPDRTATVKAGRMKSVSWRDRASGDGRASGLVMVLESAYRPGFVDAFIEGHVKNPLTPQALAGLPAAVAEQAQRFLDPAIGSTPQALIGPLFHPATDKAVIAANYHFGVSVLQQTGRIREDSRYSQELLANLSAFLEAGATTELFSMPLPSAAPTSPLEQVIHQALFLGFK